MPNVFNRKWVEFGIKDFIRETRNATRVLWLGGLPADELLSLINILEIKSRQCSINSIEGWKSFSDSCVIVRYKDQDGNETGWTNLAARHYSLSEWSSEKV